MPSNSLETMELIWKVNIHTSQEKVPAIKYQVITKSQDLSTLKTAIHWPAQL